MGNSRSSHNFSTSRSSSLSELPYKEETARSYKSKQRLRPASIASASPRQLLRAKKSSAPLRSTSLASFDDKTSKFSAAPAARKRTESKSPRPLSDLQPAAPRRYNDNYIQDDIKKLFKAHDKSNTKALVDEPADDCSAETLDKKLETLKKQRAKDDAVTEDVKVKKSKKSKKAPSLPPSTSTKLPAVKEVSPDKQKTNSLSRKKSAAPAPPTANIRKAIPEEPTSRNDSNNNKGGTTNIADVKEEQLPTTQVTNSSENATQKPPEIAIAHPLSDEPAILVKRSVVVERELVGRSTHRKQKEAPVAPGLVQASEPKQQTPHVDLQIEMKGKDTFVEDVMRHEIDVEKEERQEQTQPVLAATDIAVQCDEVLLEDKQEDANINTKENMAQVGADDGVAEPLECDPGYVVDEDGQVKEQAGSILKVFIDKNAEKDASRAANASSPDVNLVGSILLDAETTEKAKESSVADHSSEIDEIVPTSPQDSLNNANESRETEEESSTRADALQNITKEEEEVLANIVDDIGLLEDAGGKQTTLKDGIDKEMEAMDDQKSELVLSSPDSASAIDLQVTPLSTPRESTPERVENASMNDPVKTNPETPDISMVELTSTPATSPQQESVNSDQTLTSLDVNDFSKSSNWHIAKSPEPDSSSSDSKKPKHKQGGIFRITKTMRRFMSSVGKANKHHKQDEPDASQEPEEELTFATDNWMLTDKHKKPVPRKEYKPTWTEDTLAQPDHNSDLTNDTSADSNMIATSADVSNETEDSKTMQAEVSQTTTHVELRVKPSQTSNVDSKGATENGADTAGHSNGQASTTAQVKRTSSALALMTPKAYGSTPSVYRPVSKLLQP